MNLLIKNVNIVDYNKTLKGDIYIENGKIKEVSESINVENVEIIDGLGKTIMPSFIDTHAHFREPGLTYKEDLETGSRAAVRGGFTGVCLMANTSPIVSTKEVLERVRKRAEEIDLIDIHQCVSITKNFAGTEIDHLDMFVEDKGLKAISDDGVGVMDSNIMLKGMEKAKENNWVVMSHAEDHNYTKTCMRMAENIMTKRDIEVAKECGARLHMAHVSTKEAIEYIEEGRKQGVNVTCEVTPHHIFLTTDVSNYRVNPPIREKEDVQALHEAIKNGVVDCIGTDHAPHTAEDKEKGSPGMVGLETAFPICYTALVKGEVVSLNKLSELMSKNSAEILGMNKGRIEEGFDGDLVLVDLDKEVTIKSEEFHSKGKNTPFEGMKFNGEIIKTIRNGKVVYSI